MKLSGISALVTLVCSLNLSGDFVAGECNKGKRIDHGTGKCVDCPQNSYQSTPNDSQFCKPCTTCSEKYWSVEVNKCTRMNDATCQCRDGFVPTDDKSSVCKCDKGSGIKYEKGQPICRTCENGFFTSKKDESCVKWKECSSGVRVNGSKTSDVICRNNSETSVLPTAPLSPLSVQTRASDAPPVEMTSPAFKPPTSTKNSNSVSNTNLKSGVFPLTFGLIFGITLLVLVLLTYKFTITPCVENYKLPVVKTAEDSYGRPVEESGDSNLSSLVKLSIEEP